MGGPWAGSEKHCTGIMRGALSAAQASLPLQEAPADMWVPCRGL
jgi:hypothetical protein